MKNIFFIFILFVFSSCFNSSFDKQVKINEASGICYNSDSSSFFVVGDEGEITEVNEKLKKLRQYKYQKNYDFESIVCEKNNLFTIDEKTGEIFKIDINTFKILEKFEIKGYKLDKKGIEGFTKIGKNKYIISTQTKKNNLLFLNSKNNKFEVIKKIDFEYKDLSGLNFYKNNLYILSDKNDVIFKYDIEKNKILQKIKLPNGDWEGISRNSLGEIYLCDDKGKVVKL